MAEFAPEAKYEMRKLGDLKGWIDNPRIAKEDAIIRLKGQIDYLGLYKPFLINQDNIVLGGNMRLAVSIEMFGKDQEVMCSVVTTDNAAQMMDYALSDNDSIGVTDTDKVAEYVTLHPVRSELFSVQSKVGTIVSNLKAAANSTDNNIPNECKNCPLHCGEDE